MRTDTDLAKQPVVRRDEIGSPPRDDIRVVEHRRVPPEHATRFAVDWAPPEPGPSTEPDERTRMRAQHELLLKGMANRFEGEFGEMFTRDTLHHYVRDSYAQMTATSKVINHLPAFVERFARERLRSLAKVRGMTEAHRPEVLFVCLRNDAASQMAAGLLALHADGRATAHSAGRAPAPELLAEAVTVMREVGVDLCGELPKPVTVEIEEGADIVVTLDAHDDVPIIDSARHLAWRTDPRHDDSLDACRAMRDELDRRVRELLDEIAPDPLPRRRAFDDDLAAIEASAREMGHKVIALLRQANEALATGDAAAADAATAADDAIDAAFTEIEHRVTEVIALRQPVAGDLRRLLALGQTGLHLERIADCAVRVAGVVGRAQGTRPDPHLMARLTAMGERVVTMVETVVSALEQRSSDRCLDVVAQDVAVDADQEELFAALVAEAGDGVSRRWSLLSDRVARHYERAGDHAVDIAEAVWFQITGEYREFHCGG